MPDPAPRPDRSSSLGIIARRVVLTAAALSVAIAAPAAAEPPCPGPTTALVVRHAEKGEGDDPELTAEGRARAEELAHAAGAAKVRAIYTSTLKRTMQTADPTEASTGVAAQAFEPGAARKIAADIVAAHPGRTVLVVGHSNTIDDLIEHLGGPALGDVHHDDYDNLFVVTRACDGTASVVTLQFGKATPVGAAAK